MKVRGLIYTITANPALDLSGTVDRIVPNEKVYVRDMVVSPGGSGINVARIVTRLGGPAIAGGFLGGGIGEELGELLDRETVPHRFVRIGDDTRVCVTVFSLDTRFQTRLNFPGPVITDPEKKELLRRISRLPSRSFLIMGGSLPRGVTSGYIRLLAGRADRKRSLLVLDLPGPQLRELLDLRAFLIKPNLLEFQQSTGTRASSIQQVLRSARKLTPRIRFVCVSSVEGGALLVSQRMAWFGKIPRIQVQSAVGAGDAMVGAMIFHAWNAEFSDDSLQAPAAESRFGARMLRWGLAAACATLAVPGTCYGGASSIRRFFPRVLVKQLG